MVKRTKQYEWKYPDSDFRKGDAVLDMSASGRYWRSSRIERIDLIQRTKDNTASVCSLFGETEEDEYEMLQEMSKVLVPVSRIITYNGHSFDLPHLRQKCKAYMLEDPFEGKEELDLYHELKGLVSFFALPSRRLADAAAFLNLPYPEECTDAEAKLELMGLLRYGEFLSSKDTQIHDLRTDGERMIYELTCPYSFPRDISVHDTCFHIRFLKNGTVLLSARIINGSLRYYHTDIQNYEYLPLEGYAIHRQAASFVEKSRKEKAVRENCFHLVPFSESFLTDEGKARAYLASVLAFLETR